MALWNRNKGGTNAATEQGASAPRALRPNEMLASVVSESTPGPATELLMSNQAFALPGRPAWVVLGLPVQSIGGLSRKQSKDETKGSIIELVKAGHIEVVVTPELLDDEVLCIVPTASTLDRMEEYQLLRDASYLWVVAQVEGTTGKLTFAPVDNGTYSEAVAVSNGESELSTLLPKVWSWADDGDTESDGLPPEEEEDTSELESDGGEAAHVEADQDQRVEPEQQDHRVEPEQQSDRGEEEEPAVQAPVTEGEAPFGEEEDDGVDYGAMDSEEERDEQDEDSEDVFDPDAEPDQGEDDFQDGFDPEAEGSADDDSYAEANIGREVGEEEVRSTIARRFLTGDLDLVIDLEGFEATFASGAPAVTIDLGQDPQDWLGSQVAQLVRQANARLEQAYQGDLASLRSDYVAMMSTHSEKVLREVSTERDGSPWHGLSQVIDDEHSRRRDEAAESVAKRRGEAVAAFDAQLQEHAAAAAATAKASFRDRRRMAHEQELAGIGTDVDRRNEAAHTHDRQIMLERRRADAGRRMDAGASAVLQRLAERAAEQRESQLELLTSLSGEVSAFVDANRKDDVARAQALQEELDRSTEVERLTNEHAAKVAELIGEHEARARRLEQEIIRSSEQAVTEMNERRSAHEHELGIESEKVRHANELNKALSEQAATMHDTYEKEYSARIETLQQDKRSYSDELDRANRIQSRANRVLLLLVVLMAVAALAVGFIIGWNTGFNPGQDAAAAFMGASHTSSA